ncbi:hypothetical protein TorRG33x02_186530 [Trema orientale]|uniref:Uncharacterized protein n=1 Tax=Trema orientale TaxID=63057 RepID=A0A2P5EIZ4_TREOI|nr:hypothetical protein TorRG33x02_186530 [Trema orientale]
MGTSGSIMSSNSGGTLMENPSPKNWNQDLVFTMPESEGFAGDEDSAEEWASGYCSGAKETTKRELNLRIKGLLVERVVVLGFAVEREGVLGIEELGLGG